MDGWGSQGIWRNWTLLLRWWETHFHYLKTTGWGGYLHHSLGKSAIGCVCCAIVSNVLVCCESVHACVEARVWYLVSSSMVFYILSWNRVSHWIQSLLAGLTSWLVSSRELTVSIPQHQGHRYEDHVRPLYECQGIDVRSLCLWPGHFTTCANSQFYLVFWLYLQHVAF